MMEMNELTERLRDRVVGALHTSRVQAGDRLPGVREVAREVGADPRTVAKAYRELEREGLVEVRGRSGVFVARQDHWGETLLAETGRWLGGIVLEAWKRHIPVPDLAGLIRDCTQNHGLRAVCLDGIEDYMRALCAELEERFGIGCTALHARELPAAAGEPSGFPAALRRADFVVTTPFHAGAARQWTAALKLPVVAATLHPDVGAAIEARLREGELAVVCVSAAFGDQIRTLYGGNAPERIRVFALEAAPDLAHLAADEPVLLTLAAQERLGPHALRPLVPFRPLVSPETAREIAELMIRLHMQRQHARRAPPARSR